MFVSFTSHLPHKNLVPGAPVGMKKLKKLQRLSRVNLTGPKI